MQKRLLLCLNFTYTSSGNMLAFSKALTARVNTSHTHGDFGAICQGVVKLDTQGEIDVFGAKGARLLEVELVPRLLNGDLQVVVLRELPLHYVDAWFSNTQAWKHFRECLTMYLESNKLCSAILKTCFESTVGLQVYNPPPKLVLSLQVMSTDTSCNMSFSL